MTIIRRITCDADVAEGARWLAAHDVRLAGALDLAGPLPLRLRPDGFAALLNAIVSQQVSVASARAIWSRLETAGLTREATVRASSEDALRSSGLSRQKIRYAHALAAARLDFAALRDQSDEAVITTLTAVPGIGAWTAQIYAMFGLGRADVFAPGDLALQEAARLIYGLGKRPTAAALARLAEDWSPWRAVAARLLFTYYRVVKEREGIT